MRGLIVHGWQNSRPAGHWQRELAALGADGGERVLICHSLVVLLWWQVAPPGIEAAELPADLRARVRFVAADDDPYFPGGAAALYADRFGLDPDVVPGGQHLDLPAGYGSWPSVHAWCTDPSVRITAR